MKRILYTLLLSFTLCSCYTINYISAFSKHPVELGIAKQEFIKKYGKPYNQEVFYNNKILNEKLLYKEELYTAAWYVVTTAFYFENSKLIKQEIVKEERKVSSCDCKKE